MDYRPVLDESAAAAYRGGIDPGTTQQRFRIAAVLPHQLRKEMQHAGIHHRSRSAHTRLDRSRPGLGQRASNS